MMKVENMLSAKGNRIANQFVITDDTRVTFQSYESTIVEINYKTNVITVGRDWDYSTTTGKYRNLFMSNYNLSDMDSKKGFETALNNGIVIDDFSIEFKVIKLY